MSWPSLNKGKDRGLVRGLGVQPNPVLVCPLQCVNRYNNKMSKKWKWQKRVTCDRAWKKSGDDTKILCFDARGTTYVRVRGFCNSNISRDERYYRRLGQDISKSSKRTPDKSAKDYQSQTAHYIVQDTFASIESFITWPDELSGRTRPHAETEFGTGGQDAREGHTLC